MKLDLGCLSAREQEILIEELADRMIDIVTVNAYKNAKQAVKNLLRINAPYEGNDLITVSYDINFTYNDFGQIIARRCRSEIKHKRSNKLLLKAEGQ